MESILLASDMESMLFASDIWSPDCFSQFPLDDAASVTPIPIFDEVSAMPSNITIKTVDTIENPPHKNKYVYFFK
jgi:hypothetical protein